MVVFCAAIELHYTHAHLCSAWGNRLKRSRRTRKQCRNCVYGSCVFGQCRYWPEGCYEIYATAFHKVIQNSKTFVGTCLIVLQTNAMGKIQYLT